MHIPVSQREVWQKTGKARAQHSACRGEETAVPTWKAVCFFEEGASQMGLSEGSWLSAPLSVLIHQAPGLPWGQFPVLCEPSRTDISHKEEGKEGPQRPIFPFSNHGGSHTCTLQCSSGLPVSLASAHPFK